MDALQSFYRRETYVIGFTENTRYSSMDDENLSPSPTDKLGYSSPALDYAERSNRGAENMYLDKTLNLERMQYKSVGKIKNEIFDITFELNERRRAPSLGHSFKEGMFRCESSFSDHSSVSLKSSESSGPMVEVQQLPPRERTLPDISVDTKTPKKKKTGKTGRKKPQNTTNLPRLKGFVNTVIEQNRFLKENDSKQDEDESRETDTVVKEREKSGFHSSGKIKFKFITEKLVEANKLVRQGMDLGKYSGRYHTPDYNSSKRRLSYCQSSYDERKERERINNIQRRHVSLARTGPLDFSKLRRQITTGRSSSFVC